MNVSVQDGPVDVKGVRRKILVAEKDFSAGDIIYKVLTHGRAFCTPISLLTDI